MKGKGTTDAIFIVSQMREKFRAKGKKLYFGFVDLANAFDRVPREVIRWQCISWELNSYYHQSCLCILVQNVVRTVYGNSNGFEVPVGMHQGSALSPLLFMIIIEASLREFRVALPWELLYADDLVVPFCAMCIVW